MNFVLKTINQLGETVLESSLEVTPHSVLIQTIPEFVTPQQAQQFHQMMVEAISSGSPVISMYDIIGLKVLEITD
jgi:hypothetical protein